MLFVRVDIVTIRRDIDKRNAAIGRQVRVRDALLN